MLRIGLGNSTKIESIPYFGGVSLRRQPRGRIPIDGDGDQRLEAAGGKDDPETTLAEQAIARAKGFGEISKFLPVTIYSPTLSV